MTDDIKALVTELREVKPTWDAARRAADTIEALEAENESLRIDNLGHELGHTDAMLRTRLARAEEAARTNAAEADAALKSLKKAERKLRRVENTKAYVQIQAVIARAEPSDTDEREALRDEIAHWQIGSGYYQASIGIDEARDIADHLIEQGWHRQAQITDAQADARAALEAAEEARRVE